jgi:hypothetical protein
MKLGRKRVGAEKKVSTKPVQGPPNQIHKRSYPLVRTTKIKKLGPRSPAGLGGRRNSPRRVWFLCVYSSYACTNGELCQCATVEPSKFFAKLQHILQKRDIYIYIYIVLASRSLWLEEERERNTDAVSPDLTARMQGPDLPCRFLAGGSVLSTCVGKKHGV